jgi:hypothetical protein
MECQAEANAAVRVARDKDEAEPAERNREHNTHE